MILRDDRSRSDQAAVAAIHRPTHHPKSQLSRDRMNRGIVHADRRTEKPRRWSGRRMNGMVSPVDFPPHKRSRHRPPPAGGMRIGVIFDCVTFRNDPAAQGGISFDFLSDHEKCRLRILLGKQVEDSECSSASGPSSMVSQTARSAVSKRVSTSPCHEQFLRSVGYSQRKSCVLQAIARARPRNARTPKTAASRPASTKCRVSIVFAVSKPAKARKSIRRHNRVCVPASSKLSRTYLKCDTPPALRGG